MQDIIARSDSKIIAGQVIGARSLILGNVGAENADKAIIGAGVDLDKLQLYYDYQRDLITKQEEYDQVCQLVGVDTDSSTLIDARKNLIAAKRQLAQLNMSSETEEQQKTQQLGRQTITVNGEVCKGTEIRIGNACKVLKKTLSNVLFSLVYGNKNDESDVFVPAIIFEKL